MLSVSLQASQQLILAIFLLYVVTGVVWLVLPIAIFFKGAAILLHSIHFYTLWYHVLSLQSKEAIVTLRYLHSGEWLLIDRQGNEYYGSLQTGSLCMRYVVVLHFQLILDQQYRCVFILSDSLPSKEFRELRQFLRWGL